MVTENPTNILLNELMQKWQDLQNVPNVFLYQLEITNSKLLPGLYKFYSEHNPKRIAMRRLPQTIISLNPQFSEEKFNFKKVSDKEVLLKHKFEEEISFIINNSPVTKYHILICPNVEKSLPQRITLDAVRFCAHFLMSLEGNRYFRIGYNSPGALASVNHLHLHLMLIEKELYIDRAELQRLSDSDIYRLHTNLPTEAICFIIDKTKDNKTEIDLKLNKLNIFLIWLCDHNIPHNIFMTPTFQKMQDSQDVLKIFVYAREKICVVKDLYKCNLGFCELSGFVPLGSKELYDSLTDHDVIEKIKSESGGIYSKIYKYFTENI